jgi:hypothetical protein
VIDEVYIMPTPISLKSLKIKYQQRLQQLINLYCKIFGKKPSISWCVQGMNEVCIELA